MKYLDYILHQFGFESFADLQQSCWHFDNQKGTMLTFQVSSFLGFVSVCIEQVTGFAPLVFIAFALLIFVETISGIQASLKKGKKLDSRRFGRMFLKLGYYLSIIIVLHAFNKNVKFPTISDYEVDPFLWMYHAFAVAIVMQMIISILENLSALGYKESKGITGILIRKFNKWFGVDDTEEDKG